MIGTTIMTYDDGGDRFPFDPTEWFDSDNDGIGIMLILTMTMILFLIQMMIFL